jgi:SP family facilitated glucose transporter-like MFS transporter 8
LSVLTTVAACLTFLVAGTFSSWTSPTLPRLEAADSPIPITRDQGSWIVSLLGVGGVLAPIPVCYLVDKLGRKTLLLCTALPFILSWLLIIFAR